MWKPFGTWDSISSFSAAGMLGSTVGLVMISVGFAPIVALITAVAILGFGFPLIHAWNKGTGDLEKAIENAPNAKIQTRTVAEKVLTGAAITGYVALAAVAVADVAKPSIKPDNPVAIVETVPTASIQNLPTIEPTIETVSTIIPTSIVEYFAKYECVDVYWVRLSDYNGTSNPVPWFEDGTPLTNCMESYEPAEFAFSGGRLRDIISGSRFPFSMDLPYSLEGLGDQSESNITILGNELNTVIVRTTHLDDKPSASGSIYGSWEEIAYYDKNTGLLLRYEHTLTVTGCTPISVYTFDPCVNIYGKEISKYAYELTETNFPFGTR